MIVTAAYINLNLAPWTFDLQKNKIINRVLWHNSDHRQHRFQKKKTSQHSLFVHNFEHGVIVRRFPKISSIPLPLQNLRVHPCTIYYFYQYDVLSCTYHSCTIYYLYQYDILCYDFFVKLKSLWCQPLAFIL